MAITMQSIVDRARVPLNDDTKVRHTDAQLLQYGKDGLRLVRLKRPDIFFSALSTDIEAIVIGGNFPLHEDYAAAVQDYITARAECRGNEAELESRAMVFFTLIKSQLE